MGGIFCFVWMLVVSLFGPLDSPSAASGRRSGETLNVIDAGARGDGQTNNTVSIQRQIDRCSSKGGGMVVVPVGRWVTGTLYLKSGVNLHLDEGAVLLGSTRMKDYPENPADGSPAGVRNGDARRCLLFAEHAEHISVTGDGIIDGQGGDPVFQKGDNGEGRPRIIFFSGCRDVTIQNISLRNSPFWTQYYSNCDGLVIRSIKVYSHSNWNNDGLDIDSRNVIVSDCRIDSDDDALCFKSEGTAACENITVTNCLLASNCNAIKMGTASRVGFKNITISNCVIHRAAEDNFRHWKTTLAHITADRTVLAGVALESVDGGEMDGITVSHISMTDVQTPVFIRLGDRQRRAVGGPAAVSSLRNVLISHIIANSQSLIPCSITGLPGHMVENVMLDHILITGPGGGTIEQAGQVVEEKEKSYPENRMFGLSLPASGIYTRHVRGLSLHDVKFLLRQEDRRPAFVFGDVRETDIRDTISRISDLSPFSGPTSISSPASILSPSPFSGHTSLSSRTSISGSIPMTGQQLLPAARFSTGDHMEWKEKGFDDGSWKTIRTDTPWEAQGYKGYDGYAWYRIHFRLPSSIIEASRLKDSLRINLSKIDDADEIYLNGVQIGKNGSFPGDPAGFITKYYAVREYRFSVGNPLLLWNEDNVIAIRVYDGSGNGGITGGTPFFSMIDIIDGISISSNTLYDNTCKTIVSSHLPVAVEGRLHITVRDGANGKVLEALDEALTLPAFGRREKIIGGQGQRRYTITSVFTEAGTGKAKSQTIVSSYILTPLPPAAPRINGARVFGIRPRSPFLFSIPATGERPLSYAVKGLPEGLKVDEHTGLITGAISREGEYHMQLVVSNAKGKDEKGFTIKAGNLLSLTPPMGWNSWNCWGLSVSGEKVRSSAQALIDNGLADHGWNYINIDDAWQAPKRAEDGSLGANERFPDMKGLGDWLHDKGLKFGIYSSPGERTCGRYLGSLGHEKQDAGSYARWGVDFLKYDWCSYGKMAGNDTSLETYVRPYQVMNQALKAQSRDIVYSLCQYGMKDVWKWGREVEGNCWRSTGDITDTWESLSTIGFSQDKLYPYAGPGHWNDPDMLIVGQLGWGDPHPTRLTPDEQYTHISLWCLLSAPLLIGGDLSRMDDFTRNLLTNDEVIALDQDPLGRQAQRLVNTGTYQVWMKELADGGRAIGIFNLGDTGQVINLKWADLSLGKDEKVRDCWRQQDLGVFGDGFFTEVAPHGVRLIKVDPVHNTVSPVVQNRDALYNWQSRHAAVLALNRAAPPLNVILGNSIVHYWGGQPQGPFSRGQDSWDRWLGPLGVRNMGFGWDKIENVLWRVLHGELDGYEARHVLVMIGTNNLSGNTDREIIEGLRVLVDSIRQRQPRAEILLSGLLPRRKMEGRIEGLNRQIDSLARRMNGSRPAGSMAAMMKEGQPAGSDERAGVVNGRKRVSIAKAQERAGALIKYIDPGKVLLAADGKIDESLFGDGLHPNAAGYGKLAPVLAGYMK